LTAAAGLALPGWIRFRGNQTLIPVVRYNLFDFWCGMDQSYPTEAERECRRDANPCDKCERYEEGEM